MSTRDELHEELNNRFNEMRKFLRKTIISSPFITAAELKSLFNETFLKENNTTNIHEQSFIEYCNEKLKANNKIKSDTKTAYQRGIDRLTLFDKNFNWHMITNQGLEKYENYLHGHKYTLAGKEMYYSKANIKRYLKTLRTFVIMAFEDDLIKTNPFKTFKWAAYNKAERQATKRREYLRPLEIENVLELKNIPEDLMEVYDYAVIALHSGLAIKDMKQLDYTVIKSYNYNDREGLAIYKDRGKTDEPLYIPLFLINDGLAEKVVQKRIDLAKGGKLFQAHETTIREKLKLLMAMAGISRNIGPHSLRHTFATWLLYKGVPMLVVKELMGHLKIETTEIYTHMDENHINKSLSRNQ